MKIKSTLLAIGVTTALFVVPMTVYAQTVTPSTNPIKTGRLNNLNTLCTNAVNMRITSLNSVLTRINGLKKLSSAQIQQYAGEIQADITGVQGVQTNCTNDYTAVNIVNLRNDYRSIFLNYRIYVEFLPQLRLLVASDTMGYTTDLLNSLEAKLQTRIQSAGNPSNLTSLLSDMQSKLVDAKTQYTNVESQVTGLTPTGYDSNPSGTTSVLQSARAEIKTGALDIQTAFSDAKQIRAALSTVPNTITPSPTQ